MVRANSIGSVGGAAATTAARKPSRVAQAARRGSSVGSAGKSAQRSRAQPLHGKAAKDAASQSGTATSVPPSVEAVQRGWERRGMPLTSQDASALRRPLAGRSVLLAHATSLLVEEPLKQLLLSLEAGTGSATPSQCKRPGEADAQGLRCGDVASAVFEVSQVGALAGVGPLAHFARQVLDSLQDLRRRLSQQDLDESSGARGRYHNTHDDNAPANIAAAQDALLWLADARDSLERWAHCAGVALRGLVASANRVQRVDVALQSVEARLADSMERRQQAEMQQQARGQEIAEEAERSRQTAQRLRSELEDVEVRLAMNVERRQRAAAEEMALRHNEAEALAQLKKELGESEQHALLADSETRSFEASLEAATAQAAKDRRETDGAFEKLQHELQQDRLAHRDILGKAEEQAVAGLSLERRERASLALQLNEALDSLASKDHVIEELRLSVSLDSGKAWLASRPDSCAVPQASALEAPTPEQQLMLRSHSDLQSQPSFFHRREQHQLPQHAQKTHLHRMQQEQQRQHLTQLQQPQHEQRPLLQEQREQARFQQQLRHQLEPRAVPIPCEGFGREPPAQSQGDGASSVCRLSTESMPVGRENMREAASSMQELLQSAAATAAEVSGLRQAQQHRWQELPVQQGPTVSKPPLQPIPLLPRAAEQHPEDLSLASVLRRSVAEVPQGRPACFGSHDRGESNHGPSLGERAEPELSRHASADAAKPWDLPPKDFLAMWRRSQACRNPASPSSELMPSTTSSLVPPQQRQLVRSSDGMVGGHESLRITTSFG